MTFFARCKKKTDFILHKQYGYIQAMSMLF